MKYGVFAWRMFVTWLAFMASILVGIWLMDQWFGTLGTWMGPVVGGGMGLLAMLVVARPLIKGWALKAWPK